MSRVSGNPEPLPMQEFALLLRAGTLRISAVHMMYDAAGLLREVNTAEDRVHNDAILMMVARLLDFSTNQPDIVERVLRSLPPPQ